MIKLPKEINNLLKSLEKQGIETYVAGECVRDSIMGITPFDWDVVAIAEPGKVREALSDELKKLGDKASKIDDDLTRLDYTVEEFDEDGDSLGYSGIVVDVVAFSGAIEEYLSLQDFTINALADNPDRAFVDPFEGREDIKKKLVRTIIDADLSFKEEPIRMMRAVRYAADLDFDLQKKVYEAIAANWKTLMIGHIEETREEFERVVVTANAGKGLNLLASSGLLTVVLGEDVAGRMNGTEMRDFKMLCENIDKTKPVRARRLGLVYSLLSKKKGLAAIERLNYDAETLQHLTDAMLEMINIQFLTDPKKFKQYLVKLGMDRYNYVHNLSKAQRIVYDLQSIKIESRNHYMKEIIAKGEPVFAEDLVIDANDIMEAGITDDPGKAEQLLLMLTDVVHLEPTNNERTKLLKKAKTFSKNKFAAKTRGVKWMR